MAQAMELEQLQERVILLGVSLEDERETRESLEELAELAGTAGRSLLPLRYRTGRRCTREPMWEKEKSSRSGS